MCEPLIVQVRWEENMYMRATSPVRFISNKGFDTSSSIYYLVQLHATQLFLYRLCIYSQSTKDGSRALYFISGLRVAQLTLYEQISCQW